MKKTYETPICQTIYTAEDDILTTSKFINFELSDILDWSEGDGGGAVMEW